MTSKGRPRSRDFNMQPNLNTGQFSQGTLFSGGERTGRWPKGYTPERIAEVRKTIRPYGAGQPAARAAATANVARSTIPMSDLKHPLQIHTGPSFFEPPYRTPEEGTHTAGYYESYDGGRAHVRPEEAGGPTLIHELGHHKSFREGTEHSRKYSYDALEGGQEEAYADDYAAEHYRTPKGKPAPVGTYGGGSLPGRSMQFWAGYHANRQTGPDAEKRRYDNDRRSEVVKQGEQIEGQLPLLSKNHPHTSSWEAPKPPEWDYEEGPRRHG